MSNHFIAINRGLDGFKVSDFTTGTSTSASSDVELRIADVDGQGKAMTRKDVLIALEAFERQLESGAILTNFPVL
jgi:hypothetical protein